MKQEDNNIKVKFSKRHLMMALKIDRRQAPPHADGYGKNVGSCGDIVEFYLIVDQDRIEKVYFETDGCMNTTACSNALAELATGKQINEVWRLKPEDVIDDLLTLPEDHHHCAELVVGAMYHALADLTSNIERPWMKLYRVHK
jgi:nitrogen fixation NifU-like protein